MMAPVARPASDVMIDQQVARMQRSGIRDDRSHKAQDSAMLHPGYAGCNTSNEAEETTMEQVLLKLAESAANGGWPAAFAIAVVALACMGGVFAVAWFLVELARS